jgi:hypothetical protein
MGVTEQLCSVLAMAIAYSMLSQLCCVEMSQ